MLGFAWEAVCGGSPRGVWVNGIWAVLIGSADRQC